MFLPKYGFENHGTNPVASRIEKWKVIELEITDSIYMICNTIFNTVGPRFNSRIGTQRFCLLF